MASTPPIFVTGRMGKIMDKAYQNLADLTHPEAAAALVMDVVNRSPNGKAVARMEAFTRAIQLSRPETIMRQPTLIPAGMYWSSSQERAVTREQIMIWASADYDLAEGDRFWPAPRKFLGLTCIQTAQGKAWMLAAYVNGKCIASEQCADAFHMMVHFDAMMELLDGHRA